MKTYTIYNTQDGEIDHIISGNVDADPIVYSGMAWIDGAYSPNTHYVFEGVAVPYTLDERAAKALRPTFHAQWSNVSMSWVDLRTLSDVKNDKVQSLAASWDAEFHGGMDVGAFRVPTDQETITDYLLLRQIAAENDWISTPIRLSDGTYRPLTQAQAAALWTALKTHRRTLLGKLHDKIALVQAATTIGEVDAIQW